MSTSGVIIPLFTAAGTVVGGVVATTVAWWFNRPVQKADVDVKHADVSGKHTTVQSQLLDEISNLAAENRARRKSEDKLSESLGAARRELADTRHVLRLMIEALDQVIPLLSGVGNGELKRLTSTLDRARLRVNGDE